MDTDKPTLREMAEAYQRRMRAAHEKRLQAEVAEQALRIEVEAAGVERLAAAFAQDGEASLQADNEPQ